MQFINHVNKILKSKFTLLLASLVLFLLIFPYAADFLIFRLTTVFLTLLIFTAVIFAIPHKRSSIIFFIIIAILTYIFNSAYAITGNNFFRTLNALGFLLFSFAAIGIFTKEVMRQHMITRDILMGSICIYLLIGLAYAALYTLIEIVHPGSFMHTRNSLPPSNTELVYFSYTTLTTTGYGDIISTSTYSKSFVVFESITGIFYIAMMVARLVSSMVKQSND